MKRANHTDLAKVDWRGQESRNQVDGGGRREDYGEQRIDASTRYRRPEGHRRRLPLGAVFARFVIDLHVSTDSLNSDVQGVDRFESRHEDGQRKEGGHGEIADKK